MAKIIDFEERKKEIIVGEWSVIDMVNKTYPRPLSWLWEWLDLFGKPTVIERGLLKKTDDPEEFQVYKKGPA